MRRVFLRAKGSGRCGWSDVLRLDNISTAGANALHHGGRTKSHTKIPSTVDSGGVQDFITYVPASQALKPTAALSPRVRLVIAIKIRMECVDAASLQLLQARFIWLSRTYDRVRL